MFEIFPIILSWLMSCGMPEAAALVIIIVALCLSFPWGLIICICVSLCM